MVPRPDGTNPYQTLLANALSAEGVRAVDLDLRPGRAAEIRGQADVVHLHWPEYLFMRTVPGVPARLVASIASPLVLATIGRLQRSGVRVVWTVHNARPHAGVAPRIHDWLYREAAQRVDAVIVHTEHAARHVRDVLGRDGEGVFIAPHGNYLGAYPEPTKPRHALREAWNIPAGAPVFLAFGQIRRYKRLPALARAFMRYAAPDARLLIAGAPTDSGEVAELGSVAAADPRIVLRTGWLNDSEVADLHAVADTAIINYRELFSSGVFMLALTLAVPVLVPETGSAGEVGCSPAVTTFQEGDLTNAIARAADARSTSAREAARRAAERFPWSVSAARHIEAYGCA
jgi:beta-1,4-mannosyltransferase